MADTNEKYFPFRSVSGDRKYSAEDWAAYFALFLSNGVFYSSADKLKVVTNEGMKVKVNKGAAFVNGRGYRLEADKTIILDTADGVLNRIDRIVLRCDYANRLITIAVKKGSYSQVPVAEELTRDADVYELALADIYVAAGVVTITTANITDQRLNTSLCGIVTGLVDQADTTEIFNQFQAYMLEFEEAKEEEFQIWFDTIKNTLEGDVVGNLQNQIGNISELKTENKTDLVAAINEVKNGLDNAEVDGLTTMEQVEACTEPEKPVGAGAIKELNDSLDNIGSVYITTWTITSSSTAGTDCTTLATVPKGVYIISYSIPRIVNSSNAETSALFQLKRNGSGTNNFNMFQCSSYGSKTVMIEAQTDNTTFNLAVYSNEAVNFTNTERGGLMICRVK